VLSVCGRCPRRERSAHAGASPPLSRSLGCGGGGAPPKGLWPPAEPPTPYVLRPTSHGRTTVLWFSLLSTARPAPGGGEACVRTRCWVSDVLVSIVPLLPACHCRGSRTRGGAASHPREQIAYCTHPPCSCPFLNEAVQEESSQYVLFLDSSQCSDSSLLFSIREVTSVTTADVPSALTSRVRHSCANTERNFSNGLRRTFSKQEH
jgi:hypothetical protein